MCETHQGPGAGALPHQRPYACLQSICSSRSSTALATSRQGRSVADLESPMERLQKWRGACPSLPDPPTGRHAAEGTFGRFRRRNGSDGHCASRRLPGEHHHGTGPRLVGAGHRDVGPGEVRRPQDAPAVLDGHQPHRRRAAVTVRAHRHDAAVGRRLVRIDGREVTRRRERRQPAEVRCVAALPTTQLRTSFVPMTSTRRAPWPPPTGLRHGNRSRRALAVRPVPTGGRVWPEAGRRMASRREAPPPLPTDATMEQTTCTRRPSREPSNGASTSAPASAPSGTNYPPRPAASSSSAWTTSTKCSDGSKAACQVAGGRPPP